MIGAAPVLSGPTLADAEAHPPGVVVIGAGPAGSLVARELARAGVRVLLVDKAAFPRDKVCGCCLSAAAVGVLERVGLGQLPVSLGAKPLERFEVACSSARATVPIRGGFAVSRASLDAALAADAVRAGATLAPSTAARVESLAEGARRIALRSGGAAVQVRCRLVIAADGLAGTSLDGLPGFEPHVRAGGRMGAAAIVDHPSGSYHGGTIFMACGRRAYVGLVRIEDERLDVAAAMDPGFVREAGGPGAAAASVIAEAGFEPVPELLDARWRGTPPLTRRRRVEGPGLLVIGDAARYVEPFTGEGMAWALASAAAVVPVALAGLEGRTRGVWMREHRRLLAWRHRVCSGLATALRHPRLTRAAVRALAAAPAMAGPVLRVFDQPWSAGPRRAHAPEVVR